MKLLRIHITIRSIENIRENEEGRTVCITSSDFFFSYLFILIYKFARMGHSDIQDGHFRDNLHGHLCDFRVR